MKYNFEKYNFLIISIFIVFILIIIFLLNIFKYKNELYKKFYGICITDNIVSIMVNNRELKTIYKNKVLYLDGKEYKYNINKITKNIIKKKNIYYHEVFIKFKFNYNKYKDGDVLNISIRYGKEKIINMFKIIWKGEIT